MTSRLLRIIILSAVLIALISVRQTTAHAAAGITVTPAQLKFSLSKDAPSQRAVVTITNNYDTEVVLNAQIKAIDEDAGVLVPTDATESKLAPLIKLSETDIRLQPHQPYQLTVQLNNSDTLPAGGSYASLLLTQQGATGTSLSLRAAISVTIFAIKVEGTKQSLQVSKVENNGWLFHLPSSVKITYANSGNVHVVPRATVAVAKHGSDVPLKSGVSNQNSVIVLPDDSWTDSVQLQNIGSMWRPGKVQLVVAYRADGAEQATVLITERMYIPWVYPVVLVGVSFALLYRKRIRIQIRQINLQKLKTAKKKPQEAIIVETELPEPAAIEDMPVAPEQPLISLETLQKRTTKVSRKKHIPVTAAKPKKAPKKVKSTAKKSTTTKKTQAKSKKAKSTPVKKP